MATETAPKVRLVRCPKCLLILPEVADVPIYKCGGCDAILVAKNKKAIAKTTSVLQEAEAVGNQSVRLSELGESSGSGLQDVVPSPLERRLSQESGGNRDVSTGSHSEEHGEDVSLEGRYEKDRNTSRDSDGDGEMLDENRSTGSHSEEQDQHLLVEGRRNSCYEKEQNASRDSDGDMLGENRSTDSRSKEHGENLAVEGQRNGRYEKDQDTSRDDDGDMVDESRSIDSHSEEHGENLSVEGHNGSYEADQIASRDGDGDMVDENGPNEGQQNGTGLLQTESLEHCDVRLPGVSIEGSLSTELHHENEELVLEAETNLETEANDMSLQLEGANSQLETNDKVDSNTGGSPKCEHHRFNSVRSMDTYGTVDFVSIGSEFSGPIEYLSKSTTIRSSHAYDGSISSYDGMDDHFPDQQLHSFENNYKPANLSSDFSNKKHYAMRRYGKWHRDEPLEPVTHHRPLRNWPRLERDQYPSQIPLSQRVPLHGYESAGPSHESRDEFPFDSAFHPFKKAEYGKEEKMKLLKMVYELQNQISKTCQLNEKTNGNASSDVPWKQEHFSTYNHQKEPPEDEILYPTYYGRHGPRNSWSQRSRCSHVPFSGGAINTRHGIDNTCLCCHPQAWQHSEQLPPPVFPHNRGFCRACGGHNCYNSFSSCPSTPQRYLESDFSNWIHESQSDDQRYRDHEMKRYLREKHHSARRHIRPTAGGAPFLTCYYCITPLQLPADFLLFKRRFHQLRCGACSKVLKLSLQEGTHIVPYDLVAEAPPPSEVEATFSPTDDTDVSDTVLKYISQVLLEEDMEEKPCMFHDSLALQAAEKSLYEVLGESYPPRDQAPVCVDPSVESPDNCSFGTSSDHSIHSGSSSCTSYSIESQWNGDFSENNNRPSLLQTSIPENFVFQSTVDPGSRFSSHSQNGSANNGNGFMGSSASEFLVPNYFSQSELALHFKRGFEEASKFLPKGNQLNVGFKSNALTSELKQKASNTVVKVESDRKEYSPPRLIRKKSHEREDEDLEERNNKQSAVLGDESELSDMFDKVLICARRRGQSSSSTADETLPNGPSKTLLPNEQTNGSSSGKARGKKQGKKKVVDLRTLLILCAQAITSNDNVTAKELIKQIRQHSSPYGDGSQRLAHYFVDALEARLAGTGTQIYTSLVAKRMSAADMLKAYQVYISVCPFVKVPIIFANNYISKAAEKATKLHIIDFGIFYGFHWPALIHRLANRPGGPPKLRITGIEFPQPGFRPAEAVQETGRRLVKYCERYNVPFEYHAIAQKWETIRTEDLKINSDEVIAVNCLCRFRNLLDETVVLNSPRDTVLNLIRKINPDVFVHSVVNGSYNAPFFVTRFREALFHFSSLFDMCETNVSHEDNMRSMLEQKFYGREIMNIVACEGTERVERPESYKQWQVRNMRAGFVQLPLNPELMKRVKERVNARYHSDFMVDVDGRWMLQGWKGRIIYASSAWIPA